MKRIQIKIKFHWIILSNCFRLTKFLPSVDFEDELTSKKSAWSFTPSDTISAEQTKDPKVG